MSDSTVHCWQMIKLDQSKIIRLFKWIIVIFLMVTKLIELEREWPETYRAWQHKLPKQRKGYSRKTIVNIKLHCSDHLPFWIRCTTLPDSQFKIGDKISV